MRVLPHVMIESVGNYNGGMLVVKVGWWEWVVGAGWEVGGTGCGGTRWGLGGGGGRERVVLKGRSIRIDPACEQGVDSGEQDREGREEEDKRKGTRRAPRGCEPL